MTRRAAERAAVAWRTEQTERAARHDRIVALWVVCQATFALLLAWSVAPRGLREAAWLGAAGSALAVPWLALRRPGTVATRCVASAAAMLLAAQFARLGGERLDVPFAAFATLALVALYVDPLPIGVAFATMLADVALRAGLLPQHAFGGDGAPLAYDRVGIFGVFGALLAFGSRSLAREMHRVLRLTVERDDALRAAAPALAAAPAGATEPGATEPAAPDPEPLARVDVRPAADGVPGPAEALAALAETDATAALAAVVGAADAGGSERADHDWQLAAVRRVHERDQRAAAALAQALPTLRRATCAPSPPHSGAPQRAEAATADALPAQFAALAARLGSIAAQHDLLAINVGLAGARAAAGDPDLADVVAETDRQARRLRAAQRDLERLAAVATAPPPGETRPADAAAVGAALDTALSALQANADDLRFAFGAEGTAPPSPAVPDDWPGHQLEVLVG